jgi:ribonucleoside-diphosphate reductase alpha chain
MKHRPIGIGA